MKTNCNIIDLGKISYKKAYAYQRRIVDEIKLKLRSDTLVLCEHLPVITLGRTGKIENLNTDTKELKSKKIDFFRIDRGGDITAHEPGQLTVYPIINLKARKEPDIRLYLNNLQLVILNTLWDFGINAQLIKDKTGVWVKDKKIASIGVGITQWITYHGLSINVTNSLETFSFIRPCGMDIGLTSLALELKGRIDFNQFKQKVVDNFKEVFKLNFVAQPIAI